MKLKERYLMGKYKELVKKNETLKAGFVLDEIAMYRWKKAGEPAEGFPAIISNTKEELKKEETKEEKRAFKTISIIIKTWHFVSIISIILLLPFVLLFMVLIELVKAGEKEIVKDRKQDNL